MPNAFMVTAPQAEPDLNKNPNTTPSTRTESTEALIRLTHRRSTAAGPGAAGPPGAQGIGPELGARALGVPRPIPGGIQLLGPGIEVFHLFPPGSSEPDTITEFQQLRKRWQDRRHRCRDNAGLSSTPRT
jgi:hypothetical protein